MVVIRVAAAMTTAFCPSGPSQMTSMWCFGTSGEQGLQYQQFFFCLVFNQWIGLRENLQETIDFPIQYGVFL